MFVYIAQIHKPVKINIKVSLYSNIVMWQRLKSNEKKENI